MPTIETTAGTTLEQEQGPVWRPNPPWWSATNWTTSATTSTTISATEVYAASWDNWTTTSITAGGTGSWILSIDTDGAPRGRLRLAQSQLVQRARERQWRVDHANFGEAVDRAVVQRRDQEARHAVRMAQMQRSVDAVMGARGAEICEAVFAVAEAHRINAEERAEARAVYEQLQTAQSRARDKARALLLSRLSPEQVADYTQRRFFYVNGQSGRRYRIRHGRARNVEQVTLGSEPMRLVTLCAHPAIDCPDEDTMLTQMLWLQSNEAQFLQVANRS